MKMSRRSFLRLVLLILVGALVLAVAYVQFEHRYNYGHFVPYGLHVDVVSEEAWIGIPGQKNMYSAEISNFSFLPVTLDGCDYLTDDFGRGTSYPYAVQRWDNTSGSWQTIGGLPSEANFCHPMPLSMVQTNRISKLLWPGMRVEVMEGEATGARVPFQKDDRARFVVFRKLGNEAEWSDGVASHPFIIEDDVPRDDVQFRVEH